VTIDDLLETTENDKKQKNDAYRRIYPWQIISGRLLKYTTGDECCYTPVIEKCNTNKQGQSNCKFYRKRRKILKFGYLDLPLQLDLLAVVQRSATIADVRRQLEEQLARQLDLLENSINKEISVSCFFLKEV
jgi:hypothetical protein